MDAPVRPPVAGAMGGPRLPGRHRGVPGVGAPVAETVAVGLAPDLDADSAEPPPGRADDPAHRRRHALDGRLRRRAGGRHGGHRHGREPHLGALADGIDELVVLGVDWGADPRRRGLPADHHPALGIRRARRARLGYPHQQHRRDPGRARHRSVARPRRPRPRAVRGCRPKANGSGGRSACPDHGVRQRAWPWLASTTAPTDMANVLWAPTFGYFLDQMMRPLVSTATAPTTPTSTSAGERAGARSVR